MEQIVDSVPVVPLLHAPESQMVDSVVDVRKILNELVPDVEQVIDVPKIPWSSRWSYRRFVDFLRGLGSDTAGPGRYTNTGHR